MKALGLFVSVILLALALFSLLNWTVLSAPTSLSIGVKTVQGPLGIILLAGLGLLTATFVAFIAYERTTALLEARRFARELHVQRELADKSEASRFSELRAYLETEQRKSYERAAAARNDLDTRIGRLEQGLLDRLSEVENGLSAHLSEVEDKVDRALQARP